MSDGPSSGGFPLTLRSGAQPRWSHRDPVEAGNPFPLDDRRHAAWEEATRIAKDALVRIDRVLDDEERSRSTPHPDPYPVRLVALAETRFDVWARRALSVVAGQAALTDYEAWLTSYVTNWLAYVADTCPRVDVDVQLRARLSSRAQHWTAEARRQLQSD